MTILKQNYFEIFQIPQIFNLDDHKLKEKYLELQLAHHPDRAIDDEHRTQCIAYCQILNDGYATLANHLARAKYILSLHHFSIKDVKDYSTIELENIFQAMEVIENATQRELHVLSKKKNVQKKILLHLLILNFRQQNFIDALLHTTKLQYIERMIELIKKKIHEIN